MRCCGSFGAPAIIWAISKWLNDESCFRPSMNFQTCVWWCTKKTLWPLFIMDGVQLPQGYSHFEEAVHFLPFSSQKFLVLILSTSVLITGHLDWESSANFSQNHPQACFLYWISFHEHSQFTGHQGKVEAFSLTPLYHFPPFHRHFDISRVITTGSSLLRIAGNRSRTGNNIWFPSASRSPLSYAPLKTLNEKGSIFKRLSFNLWESSPRSIYLFRRRKYAESQLWWHS